MRALALALAIGALAGSLATAATAQEEAWYPSRYGPEDTLGAANLLTPERVRAAASLVTTGKTYALGLEVGPNTPAYPPRSFQIFTFSMTPTPLGSNRTTYNDDFLASWLGIGTQLDGLGHVGIDHRYYNGTPESEFVRPGGLAKLGIHAIPPIVTRGVLLDLAGLKGVAGLAGGSVISRAAVEAALARQQLELREGDVVIVHTGWQALAGRDPKRFMETEPGLGVEAARLLAERGAVAVGADTWGVEVVPHENRNESFPVHQLLLTRNGIYLLENLRTDELVADRAWEFLFVLGQPRLVGAVQMVINPVAIR